MKRLSHQLPSSFIKKKTFSFSFCKPSFHFYLLTPNICTFPLLSQEKNISEKMDRLPNELLTTVIKAKHRKLANKKATFRVLPKDYLKYMADDSPCATIHRFMQRLTYNGHASIYVVLAAHMLLQPQPNLENIKRILEKAAKRILDYAEGVGLWRVS